MGFLDKAKGLLAQNADKVEQFAGQAIDKAGDLVDDKTGGKFAGVVDKAQEAAKDAAKKALADGDNTPEQS
ncbi:antitoxin [[Mycobacterium] crassicus]|uniref:Antitoxin n=1 Tax=[Mycobacterium] crassicus TaxID=2872309 RepID=A0ABU5XNG9_9MYCO|nr:antitoxin [Mycolicibacter sp. MYC098]MEB3022847.1 antitoxin [Mycolicibacter sp. MYC098]